MELDIYTDGSSKYSGDSGIGVVVKCNGKIIKEIFKHINTSTSNVAEYKAIIVGLEYAVISKALVVNMFSDSQLAIRQLLGDYKVNNKGIKPFYRKAKKLIDKISIVNLFHIPREANREADKLANKGAVSRIIVWR